MEIAMVVGIELLHYICILVPIPFFNAFKILELSRFSLENMIF